MAPLIDEHGCSHGIMDAWAHKHNAHTEIVARGFKGFLAASRACSQLHAMLLEEMHATARSWKLMSAYLGCLKCMEHGRCMGTPSWMLRCYPQGLKELVLAEVRLLAKATTARHTVPLLARGRDWSPRKMTGCSSLEASLAAGTYCSP
ncbi:hypothetical protein Dimus_018117, partial [Dionaea muscipula]